MDAAKSSMSKPVRGIWAMAYIAMVGGIVFNMTNARARIIGATDQVRQKDQQDWEDWVNQSNQHQDGNLPVEREEIDLKYRPVSNMTTLMTQYYGVSLTGLILFSTLIFGVVVYMFHGVTGEKAAGPISLEEELAAQQSEEVS